MLQLDQHWVLACNGLEIQEGTDLNRFPGGSVVKKLPAMQEIWVRSLGQEDSLQKGMATQSSILAWEIPWAEEPGGYSLWGHREWDMMEHRQ